MKIKDSHKAFLATTEDPKHFKKAAQDIKWRETMKKEVRAFEENGTWTLEELPDNKRLMDFEGVYKIKYKHNGEIERYKAWLVAKCFT